jgi:hypothetical protein
MEFLLVLIGIFLFISLIFIVTHLRLLTNDEVISLGNKRRNRQIRMYFSFATREFTVNKEFKKRMNPNGTFYRINESLFGFPATAAALLKYKKHEWIIIAFEKDKKVDLICLNKGSDRSIVSPYLSVGNIAKKAKQENQTSVLIFHNHPNINPNYYDCRRPSEQDIKSARYFAQVLNQNGLNLLEFICERGRHYEYFISPSDTFLPLIEFVEDIDKVNGQSKFKNLCLHFERMF